MMWGSRHEQLKDRASGSKPYGAAFGTCVGRQRPRSRDLDPHADVSGPRLSAASDVARRVLSGTQ